MATTYSPQTSAQRKKTQKNNMVLPLADISTRIHPVLAKNGVKRCVVFGSYARGDATNKSDIDLLVELHPESSLLHLAKLQIELEKALGKKIDILTFGGVHPLLKKSIMQEQISLL